MKSNYPESTYSSHKHSKHSNLVEVNSIFRNENNVKLKESNNLQEVEIDVIRKLAKNQLSLSVLNTVLFEYITIDSYQSNVAKANHHP